MKNLPAHDVEKLPKWAREYIATLERGFNDAHKRLAVFENREPTNTYENNFVNTPVYLPNNARVRFELGDGFYLDAQIDRDCYGRRALAIHARDGLAVQPGASNAITLRPTR